MYRRWVAHLCRPNSLRYDHTPITGEYTSRYHSGTHLPSKSGQLLTTGHDFKNIHEYFFSYYSQKNEMSIIMKDICRQQLKAETLKLTTEEWIFITVVPTVVKAITQAT